VHFRHRLKVEPPILPRVEREPVLLEGFVVIALLPEGEAEVVVGERAGNYLDGRTDRPSDGRTGSRRRPPDRPTV